MATSIDIGGVKQITCFMSPQFPAESRLDRAVDVLLEGTEIVQVLTSQADSCRFTVIGCDVPTYGQEVVFYNDTTKLFAGIIDTVQEEHLSPDVTLYNCTARDYTYSLDAKLVAETYQSGRETNKCADEIARDIILRYCPGFTVNHIQSGAPEIDVIQFPYKRPSECLKELAEYVGWEWYVDYDKDVHFFDPASLNEPAPVAITNSNAIDFRYGLDSQDLRNRVYVRGATYLSDLGIHDRRVGDGVTNSWVLTYKPHNLSVTVGGVPVTVGTENLDEDETQFDYMMNFQEKIVRCAVGTAPPAEGVTLEFAYQYDVPVIAMREDKASQAAVAAIQGGDGVYEHSIVDDGLISNEAAEAAALADLREHANPKVTGGFGSYTPGWAPGQIVDIHVGAIDNTFIVQKVTITPYLPGKWYYKIEFGGRLIGLESVLKKLLSDQQKKPVAETEILDKIIQHADAAIVSDALTTTTRTPPWICGDADAICGFVQCSS